VKNPLYIAISLVVLGIVLVIYFVFFFKNDSPLTGILPSPTTPTPLPPLPPTPPPISPKGDTLSIGTPSGIVEVKNFYNNPLQVNAENDVLVVRADAYEMAYIAKDSSFILSITASPVGPTTLAAEKELLRVLDITEEEACRLNVSVGIPHFADPELSGKQYGLSFCPGKRTPVGAK